MMDRRRNTPVFPLLPIVRLHHTNKGVKSTQTESSGPIGRSVSTLELSSPARQRSVALSSAIRIPPEADYLGNSNALLSCRSILALVASSYTPFTLRRLKKHFQAHFLTEYGEKYPRESIGDQVSSIWMRLRAFFSLPDIVSVTPTVILQS